MNNSLISIIIPVYNAEKYVAKCAISLMKQTHKNVEIIFVDDCSSDASCKIIQKFAEKDSRVKLYTTGTNGGPGKARNIGLENAHGEYIMFCDNDDTYNSRMCELMLKAMIENNADLVTCGANVINAKTDRGREYYANSDKIGYFNFNKNERFSTTVFVWNKLYKKSLIDKYNITFTTLFAEDDLFTFSYNSIINSIYGLNKKLYNFYIRKTSYTNKIAKGKNPKMKWDKLYNVKEFIDFLKKNNLLEQRLKCLKTFIRNQLSYTFAFFKFSPIEYIMFIKKYNSYTKMLNNKSLSFYNMHLKFKTPWYFMKLLNMSYWL